MNVKTKQKNTFWACSFHVLNYLLSYCGLVDPRIRASEKDLPVIIQGRFKEQVCFFFGQNWRGTCTPSSAGPATTYWTFLTLFLRSRNGVLISFARSAWQSCTPCYRILRHFLVKYQQLFCVTDNIPTLKAKEKSCNSSYLHIIQYIMQFLAIY